MKHNWTYRPFMECIENVKYTTKLQTKDFAAQGTYPVISQDESYISGYWNNAEDVFHTKRPLVIFGDHTRVLKYIDFDFVLGADGVKILLPKEDILAKYLYYYLKWYNVPSLGYSRHFKLLRDIELPIPSLDEQQAIVRELDGINRLIDLQEEQLREYDRLAQSLFYTTFGDPTTNPKGWEKVRVDSICKNLDNRRKPVTASERVPGDIPYYGASGVVDYVRDYIFDGDYLLVSEDGANLVARVTPIAFSISGKTWVNNHAHILAFSEPSTQLYVQTHLNLIDLSGLITGAVQPKLNQAMLNGYMLPLPPLALQQTFAAQIEAIEQQKALIRRSLDETRTLLAARMQYYFE